MKKLSLLSALLLTTLGTAVNAATYDFAAEGNIHENGYALFDSDAHANLPGGLQISASNGYGLTTVPFTGGDGGADADYYAYMDGNWNQDAGLGVCKTDTNSCGSDDNQMEGEYIHMVFDSVVNILSLDITGNHTAVVDHAEFWYSLDQGATWLMEDIGGQMIGGADLMVNWLTSTLDYTVRAGSVITPGPFGDVITAGEDPEMYLSAMTTAVPAVPVPAAFWLFGTALLGFISYSRRTKV